MGLKGTKKLLRRMTRESSVIIHLLSEADQSTREVDVVFSRNYQMIITYLFLEQSRG